MKMLRLVWLHILIAAIAIPVSAQQKSDRHPNDARVSKNHPTVYISFVKAGQAEPLHTGESNERIWLKLHNNTRWKLRLALDGYPGKAYGVEIFYSVKTVPRDREIVMLPKLVRPQIPPGVESPKREDVDTSETRKDDCDSLDLFHGGHLFTVFNLHPGKSLTFTVPREYLCKRSYICVNFEYEWESDSQEPEHKVCFYGYQIPDDNKVAIESLETRL